MKKEIKLSYEMLIGILQGKELHIKNFSIDENEEDEIIICPPFNGVFITHEQLSEIKYASEDRLFRMLDNILKGGDDD